MSRTIRLILVFMLVAAVLPVAPALAADPPNLDQANCASIGGQYGLLGTPPSAYCIIVPLNWNHDLVIFAHGYVDPTMPGGVNVPYIPFEQMILPDHTTTIPGIITQLGYAFAVTSYSKRGLAVVEGVDAVVDLANFFKGQQPTTRNIYVFGASEGGLITTLLMEQNPGNIFKGGVAACGPIGSFQKQINYFGDFRVVFDFFFKDPVTGQTFLPNTPIDINPGLYDPSLALPFLWQFYAPVTVGPFTVPLQIPTDYQKNIGLMVAAGTQAGIKPSAQLIATTKAAIDPADPINTTVATTLGLLTYNVVSTTEGFDHLGGQAYNNQSPFTWYHDPLMPSLDIPINTTVFRTSASGNFNLSPYETTGRLRGILVTIHNTGDPFDPYWHENLYTLKTIIKGSFWKHFNIPVSRYGHCNFTPAEALFAFYLMVIRAGFTNIPVMTAADTLADPAQRALFIEMAKQYGQPYSIYVPNVQK